MVIHHHSAKEAHQQHYSDYQSSHCSTPTPRTPAEFDGIVTWPPSGPQCLKPANQQPEQNWHHNSQYQLCDHYKPVNPAHFFTLILETSEEYAIRVKRQITGSGWDSKRIVNNSHIAIACCLIRKKTTISDSASWCKLCGRVTTLSTVAHFLRTAIMFYSLKTWANTYFGLILTKDDFTPELITPASLF